MLPLAAQGSQARTPFTGHRRVFLEKLIVMLMIKKLWAIYEIEKFITVLISVRH
jgi:hypothetical protein